MQDVVSLGFVRLTHQKNIVVITIAVGGVFL